MSNSAAAQEPSMEEILASIRRIITDEEGTPTPDQKSPEEEVAEETPEVDTIETEDSLLSSGQPMSPDDLDALFAPNEDNDGVFAKPEVVETEASSDEDGSDDEVMELTTAEIEDDDTEIEEDLELEIVEGMDIIFDETDDGEAVTETAAPPEPEPKAASIPTPAVQQETVPPVRQSSIETLISNQAANSVSESFSSLSGLVVSNQAKTMEDLLKEMLKPMLQSWLDENLPSLVEDMVAAEIRRLSGKK